MAAHDETMPLRVADYTQTLPAEEPPADPEWHDDDELEQLRRELRAKVDKGTVRLEVPMRAGYEVELDLNADPAKFSRWEENARKRRGEGFDAYRLGLQVLANQTVDIWRRGKPLGLTFRDPKLHDILGVEAASSHRARDAVIALYGGVNAGLDVVWSYMKWQEAAGRDYEGLENPT